MAAVEVPTMKTVKDLVPNITIQGFEKTVFAKNSLLFSSGRRRIKTGCILFFSLLSAYYSTSLPDP